MTKAKEIRDMSLDELEAQLNDKQKELFMLKNSTRYMKKSEKPHQNKSLKKDIARFLTVIREKEIAMTS